MQSCVINDSSEAFTILGFPIAGNNNALQSCARKAVERASFALKPLSILNHAQGEAAILRASGPTARLRHLLRFRQSQVFLDELVSSDGLILEHLERIVGRPLPPDFAEVASRPAASGGLGFQRLVDIDRSAACREALTSVSRCTKDVIDCDAVDGLDSTIITEAINELTRDRFLTSDSAVLTRATPTVPVDPVLRLISESSTSPHASAYLTALPGPYTTLPNSEFRDALLMRLGLSAPPGHSECSPSPAADHIGVHRLGCRNAAGLRTRRHDEVVSVLAGVALDADPRAFRVAREERLPEAEGSLARPGDVALNLGSGRTLVDVTVTNPFAGAGQTSARLAGSPAAAAATAYDNKLSKWRDLARSQLNAADISSAFQPLAVTALGAWDERSLHWLKRFSDACAAARVTDKGSTFAQLMTRLSVALWRGNSRLLRALHAPHAEDSFSCQYIAEDCFAADG